MLSKLQKRLRRHKRVRAKIYGTARRPRFCVFRSNRHIYGQLIDDEKGKTLIAGSDLEIKTKNPRLRQDYDGQAKPKTKKPSLRTETSADKPVDSTGKIAIAYAVGRLIAQKALEKKIAKIVFDRGGYNYHGRVKALAEGAREGGLKF